MILEYAITLLMIILCINVITLITVYAVLLGGDLYTNYITLYKNLNDYSIDLKQWILKHR